MTAVPVGAAPDGTTEAPENAAMASRVGTAAAVRGATASRDSAKVATPAPAVTAPVVMVRVATVRVVMVRATTAPVLATTPRSSRRPIRSSSGTW